MNGTTQDVAGHLVWSRLVSYCNARQHLADGSSRPVDSVGRRELAHDVDRVRRMHSRSTLMHVELIYLILLPTGFIVQVRIYFRKNEEFEQNSSQRHLDCKSGKFDVA